MPTAVRTAVLYSCEPDAAASMAALDQLARAAGDRGYTVRAAVADTAARDVTLEKRRGWRKIAPLLHTGDSALFVRSRVDLGCSADHRAQGLGRLDESRVTATAPAPWEMRDWLRTWSRPEQPAARAESGQPPPGMCCAVFPALEAHAPTVRALARRFLRSWEPVLARQDPDLLLVAVNELVANAIEHGSAPGDLIVLTLECDRRALCVGVEDRSPDPPRLRRPSNADDGGRGLRLVQQVTRDWGYVRRLDQCGKRVWMNVRLQQRPHTPVLTSAG
ncbi:ATP-binding protein [Streptomyces jumonjinensis]|uniref:ATP-binding protein n=1 Tax=Streptomyces jumonjinensis TaxID=1945 RepID=UPI003795BF77